jgi:hypothetical protein
MSKTGVARARGVWLYQDPKDPPLTYLIINFALKVNVCCNLLKNARLLCGRALLVLLIFISFGEN